MSNLQANRTLSGSFAEVWVDGARIAELSQDVYKRQYSCTMRGEKTFSTR